MATGELVLDRTDELLVEPAEKSESVVAGWSGSWTDVAKIYAEYLEAAEAE